MKNRISEFRFQMAAAALVVLLAGCRSAPKIAERPDPTLAQFISSAQTAFAQNSFDRAARFYLLALQRARAIEDMAEIGKQAYNLAAALHLNNRSAEALPYLAEAEAAFARRRLDAGPVLLLRARALRAVGNPDEALATIRRVVELNTPRDVQAQAWLLFGHLALDADTPADCEKALVRARALASNDPALRAGIAGLSARLSLRAGNPAGAGALFDDEAEAMRRAARFRDMAASLQRAGDAYAQAGDTAAAGDRYHRAARSLFGQGDTVSALRTIEKAIALAEATPDAEWGAAVAALFEEIKRTPVAGSTE